MTDSKHLSEIEAARNEFKDSVISSKKIGNDRYSYIKNKQSQADGSTSNVVIIKDKGTGAQYTISVNVSSIIVKGKEKYTYNDTLDQVQAAISNFLENIHEEL